MDNIEYKPGISTYSPEGKTGITGNDGQNTTIPEQCLENLYDKDDAIYIISYKSSYIEFNAKNTSGNLNTEYVDPETKECKIK